MLIRALIVLLAVLNLGVAAWWIASKPPALQVAASLPANTPTLQLASEPLAPVPVAQPPAAPASATVASVAQALPAAVTPLAAAPAPSSQAAEPVKPSPPLPKTVAPLQCLRFGPFASKDEAEALLSRLGALASKGRVDGTPATQAKAYRVLVPPLADAAAAQALAQKIGAAGFSDNFVMHDGENANAIALGVYHNRDGAEKRLAALRQAGFPAQLVAVGTESAAQWWADAAFAADAASVRQRGNAPAKALDCTGLK